MEDALKKKYEEIENLTQQIQKLETQLQDIAKKKEEVKRMSQTVSEVSHIQKDDILLAPISDGIFMQMKVVDPEKLFVNVGAGCVVKYPKAEAEKMVKDQETSVEESYEQISSMLDNMRVQAALSQQNARELLDEYEKGGNNV